MKGMTIRWFYHGHKVINGKRGHMLKPSWVAYEAVLWFKWKGLDPYNHFFFLNLPVHFTISMFFQLITRGTCTIPFEQPRHLFPLDSAIKLKCWIYDIAIIFMATDCGIVKTRLWWLHCRIRQKEEPSSMPEKLFFRHKLLWWQQGKIQKIIADVGKDPQTCHTNVSINCAQVAGIFGRSESTFDIFENRCPDIETFVDIRYFKWWSFKNRFSPATIWLMFEK